VFQLKIQNDVNVFLVYFKVLEAFCNDMIVIQLEAVKKKRQFKI
jgi:hypothetical protein